LQKIFFFLDIITSLIASLKSKPIDKINVSVIVPYFMLKKSGVYFTNMFTPAITHEDPKCTKGSQVISVEILGSALKKASLKTLVKLNPALIQCLVRLCVCHCLRVCVCMCMCVCVCVCVCVLVYLCIC